MVVVASSLIFVPWVEFGKESVIYLMQSGIVGNFVFWTIRSWQNCFRGLWFEGFVSKMNATNLYFKQFQEQLNKMD
jgi:carboxyl-terminal processing protease